MLPGKEVFKEILFYDCFLEKYKKMDELFFGMKTDIVEAKEYSCIP